MHAILYLLFFSGIAGAMLVFPSMLNRIMYRLENRRILDEYRRQVGEAYSECEADMNACLNDSDFWDRFERSGEKIQFLNRVYGKISMDMRHAYFGKRFDQISQEEIQ